MILKGMNDHSQNNLWAALFARVALYTEVRNCCVLLERDDGLLYIFGKKESVVSQTFDDLMSCLELDAAHLASMNGLSLNAALSRLKTLYDLGLCHRVEKTDRSRYFTYHFVGEGRKEGSS